MRIDHVIYATSDLEAATARLAAQLEIPAAGGGRHEGIGTHNEIFPLGGGYLEVLAVADADEAAASGIGRALQARLAESGDGLWAWAIAVDDVEPVAARLGSGVTTIARDGLSAHLTGVAEALGEPGLPFFIARDPGIGDPGAAGDAGGISWIEVGADAARLAAWLGDDTLPLRVVSGAPGVRAVGIGQRELR